jgi:16S rRNA (guanine527-N7)-methyltransferase
MLVFLGRWWSAVMGFREALEQGAAGLGIDLSQELVRDLTKHYELLIKWASKMNLTAIKDPVEAAHLHALDSLLFAELIDGEDRSKTVDVGSGAGFPGIPLALVRPNLQMVLLEPIRKRASFLRVALAELKLDAEVVEGRLDDTNPEGLWPAELIVSRATIPPVELARLATAKLSPGGRLILTSGAGAPDPSQLASVELRHVRRIERKLPAGELRVLDLLRRVDRT